MGSFGCYVRCAWCDWWAWDPYIIDWIGKPLCDLCFAWHLGVGPFLELQMAAEASGMSWTGGPYEPTAITRAETLLSRWMPVLQHGPARAVAEYLISLYDP